MSGLDEQASDFPICPLCHERYQYWIGYSKTGFLMSYFYPDFYMGDVSYSKVGIVSYYARRSVKVLNNVHYIRCSECRYKVDKEMQISILEFARVCFDIKGRCLK